MKIADLFKKLIRDEAQDEEQIAGSFRVKDEDKIREFISDPNHTFLVSFPRTGSHWLRALLELYFERPSLVRVFYYPENTNYLAYHTHDLELDIEHPTVIYLYRDPVDTIYSQLRFYSEPLDSVDRIRHWADLYGRHLEKWLCAENFTVKKTILRYERMKQNLPEEFAVVTAHFGQDLNLHKLQQVAAQTSKEEIKNKTPHDKRVINLQSGYDTSREEFRRQQGQRVWDAILAEREHLKSNFD